VQTSVAVLPRVLALTQRAQAIGIVAAYDTANPSMHREENEMSTDNEPSTEHQLAPAAPFGDSDPGAVRHAVAEADEIIKSYVIAAMAVAAAPAPLFDMMAVSTVQMMMIRRLSTSYGLRFSTRIVGASILSLAGGAGPVLASAGLASLCKATPALGAIVGATSVVAFSGAATFAVGQIFEQHFERGGTLLDFDAARARARFRTEFARGKTFVRDLASRNSTPHDSRTEPHAATPA
jgi:uncharacterized protein (DUF697 family)